jgi:hypothetical protein
MDKPFNKRLFAIHAEKIVSIVIKPGKYIMYALSANKKGNGGYNYG